MIYIWVGEVINMDLGVTYKSGGGGGIIQSL